MAKTKLAEPPQETDATTTAAPARDGWTGCPGCLKERRTQWGVMTAHRAYVPAIGEMVACPGSGRRVALIEA